MKFLYKMKKNIKLTLDQQTFNTDTMLLASFIKIPKNTKNILEVGTGSGILMLELSKRCDAFIDGIEIQEERVKIAIKNINLNDKNKLKVIQGDFRNFKFDKKFDLIISNPPFFKLNDQKRLSLKEEDIIARHELFLNLDDLLKGIFLNLNDYGTFYLIHRPDRLLELSRIADSYNLKIKRIKFVYSHFNKNAISVLIMGKKMGNDGIVVESPLILYEEKGVLSFEAKQVMENFL